MICPQCDGAGVCRLRQPSGAYEPVPCPRCYGCGIAHCCDGDQPSARDMTENADPATAPWEPPGVVDTAEHETPLSGPHSDGEGK